MKNKARWCGYSNIKYYDARAYGVLEFPDNEHIMCCCGKVLRKSNAGYGAGWTVPRHKEKEEA